MLLRRLGRGGGGKDGGFAVKVSKSCTVRLTGQQAGLEKRMVRGAKAACCQ